MKKVLTLLCLFLPLLAIMACHKQDTKRYSTWIVNSSENFHMNDITAEIDCNPDHSFCVSYLTSDNYSNGYQLTFGLDYLPTNGTFGLNTANGATPGASVCTINFYYKNELYYHASGEDTLYASLQNGKASYHLPPCWFVKYDNPTGDSILIEGTFNEP